MGLFCLHHLLPMVVSPRQYLVVWVHSFMVGRKLAAYEQPGNKASCKYELVDAIREL